MATIAVNRAVLTHSEYPAIPRLTTKPDRLVLSTRFDLAAGESDSLLIKTGISAEKPALWIVREMLYEQQTSVGDDILDLYLSSGSVDPAVLAGGVDTDKGTDFNSRFISKRIFGVSNEAALARHDPAQYKADKAIFEENVYLNLEQKYIGQEGQGDAIPKEVDDPENVLKVLDVHLIVDVYKVSKKIWSDYARVTIESERYI